MDNFALPPAVAAPASMRRIPRRVAHDYLEEFDNGPAGWWGWSGNSTGLKALEVGNSSVISRSPWWIDYNHAPPGAGYLHMVFCLCTKGPFGESMKEVAGENGFVKASKPRNFTDARLTFRLKGELETPGGLCDYGFGPYRLFRRANCFRTRVMMLCKTLTPLDQELIERRINDFVPNRIYDIHTHLLTPGKELPPHLCQEHLGWKEYTTAIHCLLPGRELNGLCFGFPTRNNDRAAINEWVGKEICSNDDGKLNRALVLVSPEDDPKAVERLLAGGTFIGLK